MREKLIQFLKTRGSFEPDQLDHIVAHFKPIITKRNEVLCEPGQVSKQFYFINKGCLRLYEIDSKGNEVTGFFALEECIFTVLPSFIMDKPSRDFLVSYEPSELLSIHRKDFLYLTTSIPAFNQVYQQFVEFAFIHSQMRIYSFLGMEGIDKLRWVLEHEPKLLNRISSKAVASYLGMTNSTLSKLRAKL